MNPRTKSDLLCPSDCVFNSSVEVCLCLSAIAKLFSLHTLDLASKRPKSVTSLLSQAKVKEAIVCLRAHLCSGEGKGYPAHC